MIRSAIPRHTRTSPWILLALVSLCIVTADSTNVQATEIHDVSAAGAERLALRMYAASRAQDWGSFVSLLHPDALASFHRFIVAIADADTTDEMNRLLFDGDCAVDPKTLDPVEASARFLSAVVNLDPTLAEAITTTKANIIGTVREGDIYHVVLRLEMQAQEAPISKVGVLSAKPFHNSLRALLLGDIDELIQMHAQGLSDTPESTGSALLPAEVLVEKEKDEVFVPYNIPPELISTVPAVYPEGHDVPTTGYEVVLMVTIDSEGDVIAARVQESPGIVAFEQAAIVAALQFRFKPAHQDQTPVASQVLIPFGFYPE